MMDHEFLSRATFGVIAPILSDLGYQCVPTRPGTKNPKGLLGWQEPRPPEHYLPYRHEDGSTIDCKRWGTGILAATTPGIDLDIRDRDVVRLLLRLAEDMFDGPSPIRIGAFPKALLAFAAEDPFDKAVTRWFALPGEDFTADGFKGHRVEVLGRGQQFVAYARHPGTGRRYKWARGSLLTYQQIDLAPIDEAQARAFVDAAEAVMLGAGMIPLRKAGDRYRLDVPEPAAPPPPRRPLRDSETAPWWQSALGPYELARMIDPKAARREHNGSARVRCPLHRGDSTNSLRISRGHDQALLWYCFSGGCSQADVAARISEFVR